MRSERRQWPRSPMTSDAQLLLNDALWRGSAFDISVGGVSLLFDDSFGVSENQQIQLGLAAEGAVLHLSGLVRSLSPHTSDEGFAPQSRLGIEFSDIGAVKQQLLASFLDGIRQSSILVNVIGLLGSKDSQGLAGAVDTLALPGSAFDQQKEAQENRLVPRTSMRMRVTLGDLDPHVQQRVIETETLDVSATGLLVQCPPGFVALGNDISLRLFPEDHGSGSGSPEGISGEGYGLRGNVAWVAPSGDRIGLQFLPGNTRAKQRIAQLVQQALTASELCEAQPSAPQILSTHVEFHNELGQRISAYHDRLKESLPNAPVAVIAPGYGESKKEYIALSYQLAGNGFQVLRYDHTNHVGESDGNHIHCTLGRMQRDLVSTLNYVQAQWPQGPLVVIGANLAGRVLMKVAAQDPHINLVVLLGGVMDVRQTLLTVHQDDLLKKYLSGVRHGVVNMLGLNLQVDRWLENAATEGYADLATTLRDVALVQAPIVLFAAEQDAWVKLDTVKRVSHEIGSQKVHLVVTTETLHGLENPRAPTATFGEIVRVCVNRLKEAVPDAGLSEPAEGQIRRQERFEMERGRTQHHREPKTNVEFWKDYLGRFQFLVNIHDYWQLLDHVHRSIGFDEVGADQVGIRVLDAGCGNGHFGMFLKVNQEYRALKGDKKVPLIRYTGLDFVQAGLTEAKRSLEEEQQLTAGAFLDASFVCSDLNAPLPFANHQFDRVVCNLVVGHLDNASFTISEFLRVLRPGGKLILTNLKPNSDMSKIYRNFQRQTENQDDLEEARELLNNSADIKQAGTEGVFRFLGRQEFAMLLLSAGAENVHISKSFAEQAFIAVAHKAGAETFTSKVSISEDAAVTAQAGVTAHI